jgi:hypothetical protein
MQPSKLTTTNFEEIFYENALLKQTVLGGIKLEGLDRMRVTLKIELVDAPRPPVRHNLDLYNDTQLEKFIRKVAEKLEIGTAIIAASLSELTSELENYRLSKIKEQQLEIPQTKPLTEIEKQTAIENLQSETLLQQTLEDLQATGIQGEAENAVILLLAMSSRKLHDPLSVICLAKSGTGKSYLMERVALCIPEDDKREHTQFSGNSFYYFKREEIRGKVFLIEDLHGAMNVLFPIAELQTKKRISKTVTIKDKNGQLRTITLIVEGPVSVIACTTREKIYEDNANRSILIYLDGSKEQDEKIMHYQKQNRAGLIDRFAEKQMQQKLMAMQQVLEPIKVINPFAPLINLPKEIFKPRRTLPLLLSFIEAITFYYQYQRPWINTSTGEIIYDPQVERSKIPIEALAKHREEIYIQTKPEDIEWAFKLLRDVLFRKSDELSGAAREFYEWLKQWAIKKATKKTGFYGSDVRKDNPIHPRTLSRYLQELADYGLLEITGGNRHKLGYTYKVIANSNYQLLQQSINEQIKKVMENVRLLRTSQ